MNDSLGIWRTRARWFAAEFLVIVTGVLVAVALNGWYQRQHDARNQATYLALLSRDIRQTTLQLEEKAAFEAAQLRDGIAAYRALSASVRPANTAEVAAALRKLVDRRTMALLDATYQDLLSTGNLRLIRNRRLRDQIVEFYGTTSAEYEIMNKNNAFFVDEMYNSLVIGKGLVKPSGASNLTVLSAVDDELRPLLRAGFVDEPDYLWSLPAGAPEWAQLKSTLLIRIFTAANSKQSAQRALARTRALSTALEAERK
jgi:hypothetical protein